MTLNKKDYHIRKNDKYIEGVTDVFKILRKRGNDRYDIICTASISGKCTKFTGRIWDDISAEHLRPLTIGELKCKNQK